MQAGYGPIRGARGKPSERRPRGVADRALGAIIQSAMASWPRPVSRAAPVEDGQRRQTHPRPTGYRMMVEVEVLSHPEEDNGWTVLATTVPPEEGTDTEILQAY